jgi:secondary thiamine-phosphate synthase enzyme
MNKLSAVHTARLETMASAVLSVDTPGEGFFEITRDVAAFLDEIKARDGTLLIYLRHTSASLVIQENADPDVQTDLVTALARLAPADAGWVHDVEGPDDMPAHVKSMLNGVSLQVPVGGASGAGKMALGTWQGIYVAEHRARPHQREVVLQFLGRCGR